MVSRFLAAFLLLGGSALAQSTPGWVNGQIPSAAQWNQQFGNKTDKTGGTLTNGSVVSPTFSGTIGGSPSTSGVWTFGAGATFNTLLNMPNWATTQRPASPVTGTMGFNTDLSALDVYNGSVWQNPSTFTGGSVPNATTFASSGTALAVTNNSTFGGTTQLGTGSTNFIQITGAASNPTVAVAGAGTNGALLLRSQGTGSINIGSATSGNALQIVAGSSAADVLQLTQPGTVGNPFTFGSAIGATSGGVKFNNMPMQISDSFTYSGTSSTLQNNPLQISQTIAGASGNTGQFSINQLTMTYNGFKSGQGTFGLLLRGITQGSSIVRTNVPLNVVANQAGAPGTVPAWAPTTAYSLGSLATNDTGKLYQVITAGTSAGSGGPTGTGSSIVDGTVTWTYCDNAANASYQVAFSSAATTNFNAGGISGAPVGSNFGATIGGILQNGSTFYSQNVGTEIDYAINTGASSNRLAGLQLVNSGQVQGSFQDWGLSIGTNSSAKTRNPFIIQNVTDANGYAIALEDQNTGGFEAMAGGLDMAMVTPTGSGVFGGGFFYRWGQGSSDGSIDSSGNLNVRYAQLAPTASGLTIDVPLQELTAVTVSAGGSGWSVGNWAKDQYGNVVTIATVSGTAAATVTIQRKGHAATGSIPATSTFSPMGANSSIVTATGTSTIPTAFTSSLTYAAPGAPTLNFGTTSATAINIANGSANTIIGSGSALATNATTGFVQIATMAGAPTGTVGAAGKAAVVIDTTNKKLCYSTGSGTWECSAAFTP